MFGVGVRGQVDQVLSSGIASAENDTGDLGTFGYSHKHHSEHQQGTPFPAPGLGPKANNHSAMEIHTCPSQAGTCSLQAGTCSTPAPLSMVPGPYWE